MKKQQVVILSGIGVLAVAVATATIYVPNYSEEGRARREVFKETGRVIKGNPNISDKDFSLSQRRGSMWSNMDKRIKKED